MRTPLAVVLGLLVSVSVCGVSPAQDARFVRGDSNNDGDVDISDAVFSLLVLFLGAGLEVPCRDAFDANDDSVLDVSDPIFTLDFLFRGDLPPDAPFPAHGCDPTPDQLDCASYGDGSLCVPGDSMIFDHSLADLSGIPSGSVEEAKGRFRIWYGHTSHGSQILSGMAAMRDALFNYNQGPGTLSIVEVGGDLGNPNYTAWAQTTREQLVKPSNDRNVVMWSWCGQVSSATEEIIRRDYLGQMSALEADFPSMKFIYMTGHLDGSGVSGNLNRRNQQIREFCRANGKILFDFADIESYDPDGSYYLDKAADDGCNYFDGTSTRNWAQDWCERNPGRCSSCSCAHSESLNCDRKARAFWWMMARMADGNGEGN